MKQVHNTALLTLFLAYIAGCGSPQPRNNMRVHLEPWQMAHNYEKTVVRIETFESAPPTPTRPRTSSTPTQHRKLVEPKPPTPKETTPAEAVDQARRYLESPYRED